ncbi:hypothetical protein [Novosphingopyxis sp.]|uniref:hypothetical protein n=1 Tax=Novosphingopyxis sp. TaxID=2709690 RepID=UPI003B5C3AC6
MQHMFFGDHEAFAQARNPLGLTRLCEREDNMIRHFTAVAALAGMALLHSAPAPAQENVPLRTPEQFSAVIACRALADETKRLACYDRQVAALERAADDRDIVIADRESVRETRRGLFGFSLPKINLFGGDDEEEFQEINTTIASARQIGYGYYSIELEDGARWEQTDGKLVLSPKSGQKIKIKRGAVGTFFANVNGQPGIRVRRVQ